MSKMWATCSSLDRVSKCPASSALPQTRNIGKASEGGNADHAALEAACMPGVEVVQTSGGPVNVSELRYPQWPEAEIAFSYDVVSGEAKRLGRLPGHRSYPDSPYSTIMGTADVVGSISIPMVDEAGSEFEGPRAAFVADIKTGNIDFLPESDSWQMRALALMAAKSMGLSFAMTRIISVRDGQVRHKPAKIWKPEDLRETETQLRQMYDAVNRAARKGIGVENVVHGYHCAFCPAMPSCPYMQLLFKGTTSNSVQDGDLAKTYHSLQANKTAAKAMEEALKNAAEGQAIDLGGGFFYGKKNGRFVRHKRYASEE